MNEPHRKSRIYLLEKWLGILGMIIGALLLVDLIWDFGFYQVFQWYVWMILIVLYAVVFSRRFFK